MTAMNRLSRPDRPSRAPVFAVAALVAVACACVAAGAIAIHVPVAPAWCAWAGRAAPPILLWMTVASMERAKSPGGTRRLLAGLYAAGLAVAALQVAAPALRADGNVVPALLGTAVVIAALRLGTRRARLCGVSAYLLWQIVAAAALERLSASAAPTLSRTMPLLRAAAVLVPGSGYGLFFVALGVAMWLCRASRAHLAVTFALCTLLDMMIHDHVYGRLLMGLPASLLGGLLGTEDVAIGTLYRLLFTDPLMLSPVGAVPGPFGWSIAWTMILALPFLLLRPSGETSAPV